MRRKGFLFIALLSALFFARADGARAESGFFTSNCQGCHSVSTCNGCHGHGVHSSSAKSNLNITATTNKTSYAPGETMSVTISGGYRSGWVRAILYNGDPTAGGTEVARSTGPGGMGGGSSFPITLTAKAPATPGTYAYGASWYGNKYDKSGAFFGSKWRPDPGNPNHGEEIVATNSFTVVSNTPAPAPAIQVTDSVAPATDLLVPFGSVYTGSSGTQTVTVKNTGTANLVIGAVASANPLAAPFAIKADACSNQTIAPAASCTLTVGFTPTATGAFSDSFTIPSNDSANGSVTVNISGTGAAAPTPAISVTDSISPTTDLLVPFGGVNTGSSMTQTVTVRNTGTANLAIGNVGSANPLAAPFSVKTDLCSNQTIAPAAACTITIAFAPTAPGAFTDSFSIPSNDPAKNAVTVNVSGDGAALPVPALSVTDSVSPNNDLLVPFGSINGGTSVTQTVTIRNTGNAGLILGAVGSSDALAAPFSVATDSCSNQTLAPSASCTITVGFAPATTGTYTDSFSIPSNDPVNSSVTVNVSGSGAAVPVPDIAVTDSVAPDTDLNADFGSILAGVSKTVTVTVTNNGNAALVLGSIGSGNPLAAPFSITADACSGKTLGMASSCTISIAFAPTGAVRSTDSFSIPSNDPDEPSVLFNVTGQGQSAPVPDISVTDSVAPTTDLKVLFGSIAAGSLSPQTVSITNNGNADLVLGAMGTVDPLGAPFAIKADTCSGQTLAPTTACTVTIEFAPVSLGAFADSFDIPSNDPDEASVAVSVNGLAAGTNTGDIQVTDSVAPVDDLRLPFGDVRGGRTTDKSVTVTNTAEGSLVIGSINATNPLSRPFQIMSDGCSGKTLALNETCKLTIRFSAPSACSAESRDYEDDEDEGEHDDDDDDDSHAVNRCTFNDSFGIPSDDPDEQVVTVQVSGTSVPAEGNLPPRKPYPKYPAHGQRDLDTSILMKWEGSMDPDGDDVTYRILVSRDNVFTSPIVAEASSAQTPAGTLYAGTGIGFLFFGVAFIGSARGRRGLFVIAAVFILAGTSLVACSSGNQGSQTTAELTRQVSGLQTTTTYYWKVVAEDGNGGVTESDVSSFTT
jgi:hypothetical protein